MPKLTKRQKEIQEKVDSNKQYGIEEAVGLLKELSKVKFSETVDAAINLGIDPRKSDQAVRGATSLPHGTGKEVRVAVSHKVPTQTRQKKLVQSSSEWKSLLQKSKAA